MVRSVPMPSPSSSTEPPRALTNPPKSPTSAQTASGDAAISPSTCTCVMAGGYVARHAGASCRRTSISVRRPGRHHLEVSARDGEVVGGGVQLGEELAQVGGQCLAPSV